MQQALAFEQGPIRPPSEAGSLLIRVTRNCPWNQCAFCSTYRGRKFSRRPVEEVKGDIDTVKYIVDDIKRISWGMGEGGHLTRAVIANVLRDANLPDSYRSVVFWLASGGDTVFLQDANSLVVSTDALVEILRHIKQTFPQVNRITSYARANTLASKSEADFVRLREAGLSRLHVGMESGSDAVLKLIRKGTTSRQIVEGGKRVVASGISLSLYIIPGIGGVDLSREHALESARVVNEVNPQFVRLRSLYVRHNTPLMEMVKAGSFQPPDEDSMVKEIRMFIEALDGVTTTIVSDHILNLLEEITGTLPKDKAAMLGVIDRYLGMDDDDRLLFQLGRRAGAIRDLDELKDPVTRTKLEAARLEIQAQLPGGVPQYIAEIKKRFV
ncbi:MAG: radical SAM protein [Desulfomonilaceae bacterium]